MKKRVLLPLIGVVILMVSAVTYKSNFFEIAKQIEIFTDVYKHLNMNYVDEVSPRKLMDVAITAMFDHLDPYTHYWTAQEVEEARLVHSGNYTDIGAEVQSFKNKIIIREVYKNKPADQAGLRPGDVLLKIGDVSLADFDQDAGELLKGAPGTTVEITFKRHNQVKTTSLKRKRTQELLVPFYKLIDTNVGYIKLTRFGKTAAEEVEKALRDLKAEGAEKIILDLRGNPGGLLHEAINIVNLFVPKGKLIVSTKSIVEKYNQTFTTHRKPVDTEIPLAILINGHSASASEIVSGSLQDLDRAVIIGSRSFGKGLVQRPMKLEYGAQMKLTISRYYIPSGRCIQALDYWHRDKNGNPVRTKAEDYKLFYTQNGRKVFGGGGILPDVKMQSSAISDFTKALLEQHIIFDFATQYYRQHDLKELADFKWTAADFKVFKAYLKTTDFHYETETSRQLETALTVAKNEELSSSVKAGITSVMTTLNKAEHKMVESDEAQITQQLIEEILKQYFYREGYFSYAVKHNPEIEKAVALLDNKMKYQQLLSGDK